MNTQRLSFAGREPKEALAVAARLLGVSRPTLYGLLEAHGLAGEVVRAGDIVAVETTLQND